MENKKVEDLKLKISELKERVRELETIKENNSIIKKPHFDEMLKKIEELKYKLGTTQTKCWALKKTNKKIVAQNAHLKRVIESTEIFNGRIKEINTL